MAGKHDDASGRRPLRGIRVLDFSTLLPGPFATLLLAEAGAEVVKVEREQGGDELRMGTPRVGASSINFALLNAGKRSIAIDLKKPDARERLMPLLREADVLVEQFRPGVMERLGLGYEDLRKVNEKLVYCSITGYAPDGPSASVAGHDLTYLADTGVLSLAAGRQGEPPIPPVLVADIGAGSMPAVINILLALMHRQATGEGSRLQVSIADNLFAWPYAALPRGMALGQWPRPGGERLTGGTPRYQVYATSDGRYLAAAPLEERFWQVFCDCIGLEPSLRQDANDPEATRAAVARIIASRDSAAWRQVFAGKDACASIVRTVQEAAEDPQFARLYDRRVQQDGCEVPALATPIDRQFRAIGRQAAPALGEANALLGS